MKIRKFGVLGAIFLASMIGTAGAQEAVEVIAKSAAGQPQPTIPMGGKQIKQVNALVAFVENVDLFDASPIRVGQMAADTDITDIKIEVTSNTGVTAGNEGVVGFGLITPGVAGSPHADWVPYQNCLGLVAAGNTFTFPVYGNARTVRVTQEIWLIRVTAPAAGTHQIVRVMVYGSPTAFESSAVVSSGGSDVNGVTDTMTPIGVNATGQPVRALTAYGGGGSPLSGAGVDNRITLWNAASVITYNGYIRYYHSTNPLTGVVLGNGTDATTQPTGAGATATGARLNIVEDYSSAATKTQLNLDLGGIAGPASIVGFRANGTPAARTALAADDLIFTYHSAGWQASNSSYQQGPVIDFYASGAAAANAQPGYIVISPVGSANYTRLDKHVRMPDITGGNVTGNVLQISDGTTGDIQAVAAPAATLAAVSAASDDDTKRTFTIPDSGAVTFTGATSGQIFRMEDSGSPNGGSIRATNADVTNAFITNLYTGTISTTWQYFSAIDYAQSGGVLTPVAGLIGVSSTVDGELCVVPINYNTGSIMQAIRIKYAGTDANTGFKVTIRKRDETSNATTYTTIGAQQTMHNSGVITTTYDLGVSPETFVAGYSYDILLESDIAAAQTATFYAYGIGMTSKKL